MGGSMTEYKAEIHHWNETHSTLEPAYPDRLWYVSKQCGTYTFAGERHPDFLYLHQDGVWRKSAAAEMGRPGAYYETKEAAQAVIDRVEK